MQSVAILKRTSFGDIIHSLPVVTALRRAWPELRITWITEQGYGPFISAHEGVDEVVEIGFRSMLKRGRFNLFQRRLRRLTLQPFDALLDLQGTLKSWMLLMFSRAERKIGFNKADAREPLATSFYTDTAVPMPYGLHIILQHLRLLQCLNIEDEQIIWPALNIPEPDVQTIDQALQQVTDDLVIINPFTNWWTKCWPPEHVVALSRMMREELQVRPMILWGPREREQAEKIVRDSNGAAILAPATSILQLAALLRRSRIYIGGDTGPSHLAAELGVPVVALFGPTDPRRNGPPPGLPAVVLRHEMECKGCSRQRCRFNDTAPECMLKITPEQVLHAAQQLRE